jgi:hypothetical protein
MALPCRYGKPLSLGRGFLFQQGWRNDVRGNSRSIQARSDSGVLSPHVTKADRPSEQGRIPGTRDATGFAAIVQQIRSCGRRHGGGKLQFRESPVDVSARADPLNDFLAGVASFFVTDVRQFESRLVRDLLVAIIHAKPWHAQLKPQRIKCFHPNGRSSGGANARGKFAPQIHKGLARDDQGRRGFAGEFATDNSAVDLPQLNFFVR